MTHEEIRTLVQRFVKAWGAEDLEGCSRAMTTTPS